jgi:hypothetical protein
VKTALWLLMAMGVGSIATAQPVGGNDGVADTADTLCASLLHIQTIGESQGRLDLNIVVEIRGDSDPIGVTAHVRMGPQYSVGRIQFTGHTEVNDSTLRRALTLRERELFDVGKLRRSLARLNDARLAAPVSLDDVVLSKHTDGATADITIPLRKRGRRWWSFSGPVIPGLGSYQASLSSRLPMWGRGVLDASTYLVTFNVLALATPSLGVLKLFSKAPPAVVLLERPYLYGQDWLSGIAWAPSLSARTLTAYYGREHLDRGVRALLEDPARDMLAVPVVGGNRPRGEFIGCQPPKSRWRWLRLGAPRAIDIALATVLP